MKGDVALSSRRSRGVAAGGNRHLLVMACRVTPHSLKNGGEWSASGVSRAAALGWRAQVVRWARLGRRVSRPSVNSSRVIIPSADMI